MLRTLLTSFLSLALVAGSLSVCPLSVSAQGAAQGGAVQGVGGASGTTTVARSASGDSVSANKPLSFDALSPDSIFVWVMVKIMTLFAWLLGVAMILLDNTVLYTVVYMGTYIKNLSAIGVTWEILRNIGNILLIFGFLAIGIGTILNAEWYGGKKMIPRLIMGAVLINFSLFMTEAVIDVGNFLATRIYKQINGGVAAGGTLGAIAATNTTQGTGIIAGISSMASTVSSPVNEPITSKIMNQLGLQRLYGDALDGNKQLLTENNTSLVAFFGVLLFIILSFVMFFLSFIFITRFVYLIYAIIVAPVGVVGYIMPNFQAFGSKWLHDLFMQSMTAPVMLLLLYVALRIITDASFLGFGGSPDYTGFVQDKNGNFNLSGFANVLISFFVAIGSLLAVVYGTKRFGAFGAQWASKTAGNISFGLPAWVGRATGGWAADRLARYVRTSGFGSTKTGDIALRGLDKVASGSIDVRGSKWISSGLKTVGIDAGEAQKGGYRGARKDAIKEIVGRTKLIDEAIDEKHEAETARLAKERGAAEEKRKLIEEDIKKQTEPLEKKKEELAEQKKQLEKQVEENKKSTLVGPGKERRDQETIKKLEETKAAFDATEKQIKEIEKPLIELLKNAKEAKEAEDDFKKAVAKQKNEFKRRYAHNVGEGLTSWFRLGARQAANQIVKDTVKKEDKTLKELKKFLEQKEKEEEGGGDNKGGKDKNGGEGSDKSKEEKPKEKEAGSENKKES